MQLVVLDVASTQQRDRAHLGRLADKPPGELAQRPFEADRRGPQRQPHLLDVAEQGRGQPGRHGGPCGSAGRGLVRMGLARRRVDHTRMEQGGLGAEQRGGQRTDPVRAGPMPTDRRGQLFASGVQIGLGQPIGATPTSVATLIVADHCNRVGAGRNQVPRLSRRTGHETRGDGGQRPRRGRAARAPGSPGWADTGRSPSATTTAVLQRVAHCSASDSLAPAVDTDPTGTAAPGRSPDSARNMPAASRSAR